MATSIKADMQLFAVKMVDALAANYSRSLSNMYEKLFSEHRSRTGADHYVLGNNVFFWDQKYYPTASVKLTIGAVKLADDLHEQHYDWFKNYEEYLQDRAKVKQTVTSMIIRVTTWQEVRDMFPEYIIKEFLKHPCLEGLYRIKPDLQTPSTPQQWDERLIKMYSQISGTLSMYVGYKYL